MKRGKVYLVGAGCGDEKLITVRGLELLKQCDAVVYDSLASERLLEWVRPDCEKIPVGKRAGCHSASQEEINRILVELGKQGKRTVRLKGGDPFVFGRGGEEAEALMKEGIPVEEIPGISSSIAVPAAAGIPVTHRGVSRSFHVITGHTADTADTLTENFGTLARLDGTLVFLMGLGNLEKIASGLMENGKNPDTPAAVISNGALPEQRVVRAALNQIAEKAAESGLPSPAVIVIGETAALDFSAGTGGLGGVSVGVTGTESFAEKLSGFLQEDGASVRNLSFSELVPTDDGLREVLEHLYQYHWLVFTSPNGVREWRRRMKEWKIDLREAAGLKLAVIGTGTAEALEEMGLYPDFLPAQFTVEALAEGLCQLVQPGEQVLILRAGQGSAVLPERLKQRGIPFSDIPLYRLEINAGKREAAFRQAESLDYLTFGSSSGVRGYFDGGGRISDHTTAVCIGRETEKTLKERFSGRILTAERFTAEGMAEAIQKDAGERKK